MVGTKKTMWFGSIVINFLACDGIGISLIDCGVANIAGLKANVGVLSIVGVMFGVTLLSTGTVMVISSVGVAADGLVKGVFVNCPQPQSSNATNNSSITIGLAINRLTNSYLTLCFRFSNRLFFITPQAIRKLHIVLQKEFLCHIL